ncbi:hypothetical protein [Luteolibacter sp. AS25]|uniref:hypothetical protein n=1 Tax=Luteolibacter sp. AS25 TaxID=3135776 RepID=UPI00398B9E00
MSFKKKKRLLPWLLVILPAWLIGSGAIALVQYFKNEKATLVEEEKRFSQSVSPEAIKDDLRKLITIVGERNTGKPAQLASTAAMVEGLLGPSNTGFTVKKIDGPGDFPILHVTVLGKDEKNAPVWILTSYDSPRGSSGAEKNATGLSATLATAQAFADSNPESSVHFMFLPHVNDLESPVLETATIARNFIKNAPTAKSIFCVETMGDSESLILTSRDTEAIPTDEFEGLGKILGAEVMCLGEDFDLASTLFEMGLPAIRIATRPTLLPDEEDEKIPFAPTLAASTGRLVELVKRISN